jgi:thymidylate kinase
VMTSLLERVRGRGATLAVALVGPDGAGKTSITRRVAETLPVPSRTIYMGVNLESSTLMLPTTRLILMAKRARGGRPDLAVSARPAPSAGRGSLGARAGRSVKSALRMTNWVAEEWFRQAVALYAGRRGQVVIFDRHFFCDYYAYDVAPRHGPRPLSARAHGFLLARAYPKPDLVVYLDAPAEVLHARKGEGTLEFLEELRRDYSSLAEVFEQFVVVDAARPADVVAAEVVDVIVRHIPSLTDDLVKPNTKEDSNDSGHSRHEAAGVPGRPGRPDAVRRRWCA